MVSSSGVVRRDRQHDAEYGLAGLTVKFDDAAVIVDNFSEPEQAPTRCPWAWR